MSGSWRGSRWSGPRRATTDGRPAATTPAPSRTSTRCYGRGSWPDLSASHSPIRPSVTTTPPLLRWAGASTSGPLWCCGATTGATGRCSAGKYSGRQERATVATLAIRGIRHGDDEGLYQQEHGLFLRAAACGCAHGAPVEVRYPAALGGRALPCRKDELGAEGKVTAPPAATRGRVNTVMDRAAPRSSGCQPQTGHPDRWWRRPRGRCATRWRAGL